uniref:hypothetical protein n=1 Tax=uncultured Tenacibaculum sp. TaxID=174713 RepID=UPI00261B1681|nr:hypothetical protein [uncultured Tenacibaculum sp.]
MFKIDSFNYINVPVIIGSVLAMIISWSRNKSILMALIHCFFGWLYVIYYYLGKDDDKSNTIN